MKRDSDDRDWVLAALEQFEGRLVRYARRLVGDEERARDVVQFVFLRLCDQRPQEIEHRLGQWLYTVCRNRALDLLRQANRDGVGWAVPTNSKDGGHSPPYSTERDPADCAEQAELHDVLRLLVEQLPPSQREAIDLWADGFSYHEISQIMNKQEGNIRVLVHRGLKAIREDVRVRGLIEDENEKRDSRNETSSNGRARTSPVHGALPVRPAIHGG
jgi:RNA polymerase sigma-70 factor (ECF subfamily)